MTKTMTYFSTAHEEAKTMTAAEFAKKYDDQIEWLDVDNIADPNEGVFNINFIEGPFETSMLFIDGEYQAD